MNGTKGMVFEGCGSHLADVGRRAAMAGVLSLVGLSAGIARADEVKFPEINPDVGMELPSGWVVDMRPDGVQMVSPEKNSIVVAGIVFNEKRLIDAWSTYAADKLKAFGVTFDKNAKAPPPKVGSTPAPPNKTDIAPVSGSSAFTTDPNAFTFTGKPSLAMPGRPDSNDPVLPAETSVENLTNFGTTVTPAQQGKMKFRTVLYYGTALNGKPVDVQLIIYQLPDKRFFLMMQESGPDDGRTSAIVESVHTIK